MKRCVQNPKLFCHSKNGKAVSAGRRVDNLRKQIMSNWQKMKDSIRKHFLLQKVVLIWNALLEGWQKQIQK